MGNVSPPSRDYSKFTLSSPPSQGAKAQQKRERNQAKAGGTAKSQTKINEAAKNIICVTCRQTFVSVCAMLSMRLLTTVMPLSC